MACARKPLAPRRHAARAQITTLDNGMRVATEANPHAETATVGIWINSGSRFETDANNGTAHFLEHILFKGTKVRRGIGTCASEARNMMRQVAAMHAPRSAGHGRRHGGAQRARLASGRGARSCSVRGNSRRCAGAAPRGRLVELSLLNLSLPRPPRTRACARGATAEPHREGPGGGD
jgi:hypothetical protein